MKHGKQACSRLMALGLTKSESTQLLDLVGKWMNHSGIEWTIDHLKEVKLLYLHRMAGTTYTPKHWIAKDERGIPKGPLRALFKLSQKNLSRVLTAFTMYSAYVAKTTTQKQLEKFFLSMSSSDDRGLNARLVNTFGHSVAQPPNYPPTIIEYCTSPNKRAPYPNGRTGPEMDLPAVINHAMGSVAVRQIMERWPDVFRSVIPFDICMSLRPKPWSENSALVNTLGHISGIQEPGYKLRAIANPSRVLQAALEPLKFGVASLLKNVHTDCTFDQKEAIPKVQAWLRDGRTVYSVDLSDATNLFPWPLQRDLLKDVFRDPSFRQLIDIMDVCARGPWLSRLRGAPEVVKFTRGQPLGLGPSFFTFAYAHNTLLKGICAKHGIEPRFRVLGDDVVIGDNQLHRIYRKTLDNLGCRVSASKTFESKKLAEFAGTVILANRIGHGYKWRQMSDYSFIEAARNLGKPALGMMNPFQREVTNLLAQIPKGFGGVGWSDGRKLSELSSPIFDYAIQHYSNNMDEIAPMMYRDLVADTRALAQRLSYDKSQSSLFRVMVRPGASDKIAVSDLIRSPRLFGANEKKVCPPSLLVVEKDVPIDKRYYPIIDRVGDPRPSVLPLVRAIALASSEAEQPLSKRVDSWAKKVDRIRKEVSKPNQVKKTPDKLRKSPSKEPPRDMGISM